MMALVHSIAHYNKALLIIRYKTLFSFVLLLPHHGIRSEKQRHSRSPLEWGANRNICLSEVDTVVSDQIYIFRRKETVNDPQEDHKIDGVSYGCLQLKTFSLVVGLLILMSSAALLHLINGPQKVLFVSMVSTFSYCHLIHEFGPISFSTLSLAFFRHRISFFFAFIDTIES